jgi:hypothetical protein
MSIAHNPHFNPEEIAQSLAVVVRGCIANDEPLDSSHFKRLCEDVWIELLDILTLEETVVVNHACKTHRTPPQDEESDRFIVKNGVRYDLHNKADWDQVQTIMDKELASLKHHWQVAKTEAEALLWAVKDGVF